LNVFTLLMNCPNQLIYGCSHPIAKLRNWSILWTKTWTWKTKKNYRKLHWLGKMMMSRKIKLKLRQRSNLSMTIAWWTHWVSSFTRMRTLYPSSVDTSSKSWNSSSTNRSRWLSNICSSSRKARSLQVYSTTWITTPLPHSSSSWLNSRSSLRRRTNGTNLTTATLISILIKQRMSYQKSNWKCNRSSRKRALWSWAPSLTCSHLITLMICTRRSAPAKSCKNSVKTKSSSRSWPSHAL